ncbi:hypothetical protein [Flaviflexus huanghaiensis]|uniref:hypothetical protein n=1 Tax=Flaviflexus huanghaiensis TaxID=1111473 RepID=UPI001F50D27A|nr:hypothetical protein [Flaviflexus huanghaiensis]
MEAGQAQSVVRGPVADSHVIILVDVDRLEQCLVTQSAVRVVGMLVQIGCVGQQFQRVVEVRPCVGVVAVVRVDPVLDGLQRRGDPVLLLLEKVERDRSGIVGLQQLLLFAFELGSSHCKVGKFSGSFGHHLVEPGMEHRRDCLHRLGVELDSCVEAFDELFDLLDQHRLPGAVTPAAMTAGTHEVWVNLALTALGIAHQQA